MYRSFLALACAPLCFAAPQLAVESTRASAGILAEHERQEIAAMPPQKQAERLLERAISRYEGALDALNQLLPTWEGRLEYSKHLQTLVEAAYNSAELPVRAAAIDLTLASNRVSLNIPTARAFADQLRSDPQNKPWRLWILSLLAYRGVETESTKRLLLEYIHDPNAETRQWAVNSLSMLGSDDILQPMLDVLGTDPSSEVRERAGCGLAETGMLTRDQRQKAIPGLLALMDNPSLDRTTQTWVFQALREISGQNFGENRASWRDWHARNLR